MAEIKLTKEEKKAIVNNIVTHIKEEVIENRKNGVFTTTITLANWVGANEIFETIDGVSWKDFQWSVFRELYNDKEHVIKDVDITVIGKKNVKTVMKIKATKPKLKKFTVGLYDGAIMYIDHLVGTKVVEAKEYNDFDGLACFYDVVEKTEDRSVYQNRISKRNFDVYYGRMITKNNIRFFDFGSHSRFYAKVEGEYNDEEFIKLINEMEN